MKGSPQGFDACGEYDLYVQLATLYNWSPDIVDRLDPHFVEELQARLRAQHKIDEIERKKQEAELRNIKSRGRGRGRRV